MMEPQVDDPAQVARHHGRLIARLAAEPLALASWQRDTQNPRLADAYQALLERTTPRAADLANAAIAQGTASRHDITMEMERHLEEARCFTFEPSRVKWLLAGRRDRLAAGNLPGHDPHRADEAREAEELEAILRDLLHTMC